MKESENEAKLLYQGHGSLRIVNKDKKVIYIDPFAGEGYDLEADLILVTHGHGDHTRTDLCAKKSGCSIISYKEALAGGKHNSFEHEKIKIEAVEAGNKHHNPNECVGYVVEFDNIKLYFSGDTSKTETMKELGKKRIDYAFFCGDGVYNMDIEEASECAKLVGARNNILIHMVADAVSLYDCNKTAVWSAPNKLIMEPNQEIVLN